MWWKKKEKDTPEVCGYLDQNGKFFSSKNDRDKSNFEINKKEEYFKIIRNFNNILHKIQVNKKDICRWEDIQNLFGPGAINKQLLELFMDYKEYKEKYGEL